MTAYLTQPDEVIARLMADLQANTDVAVSLRDQYKQQATYDLSTIFTNLSADTDVRAAFKRLQEQHPASDYAKRGRHRWFVNTDIVENLTTSLALPTDTISNDGLFSSNTSVPLNDLNDTEVTALAIAALAGDNHSFTVIQNGLYRISAALSLGFCPADTLQSGPTDRIMEVTNVNMKHIPVALNISVTPGTVGATTRSYHQLVKGQMSQDDFLNSRKRFLGGSVELELVAGDRVAAFFQRGSRMGQYRKVTNGVSTYAKEVLGMTKYTSLEAGSNPVRDSQNWIEIVRVA